MTRCRVDWKELSPDTWRGSVPGRPRASAAIEKGTWGNLTVWAKSGQRVQQYLYEFTPSIEDGKKRADHLYHHDDGSVAAKVREWAIKAGEAPQTRIVLAGFDTEHTDLEAHGWTVHEWFRAGYLRGGMAQQKRDKSGHQQRRERLWASPHCLAVDDERVAPLQGSLFDE